MFQVKILKGTHRGQQVSGTFQLFRPYKGDDVAGFITVVAPDGCDWTTTHTPRIKLSKGDFQVLDASGAEVSAESVIVSEETGKIAETAVNYEEQFASLETEEEAMERISETFLMLDKITDACAKGIVRGLVVSGPPGIGKSFGVEKQLEAANMFLTMANQDPKYEVISGGISSIGLFQKLWHNRHAGRVLAFDDCDGVLFDEECLNLLKAALNSGDKRRINWNKESRVLKEGDIPDSFDFEASIIFLSNVDFEKSIARGSRISAHLGAIMSRCHYMDLEIGSLRDKMLRIKQIVRDGMLTSYEFKNGEEQAVIDFIFTNSEYLREVSLRMVKKIADFAKADPKGWMEMAESTCLLKEAKFKRLLEKKQREAEARGISIQG